MTQPDPAAIREFFELAARCGFVRRDDVARTVRDALGAGISPQLFAAEHGLLDATQIEILEALRHPDDVAPGYHVMEPIGYGGMGVVYRAKQKALGRVVALKSILLHQLPGPSQLARFEQEARTMARLSHPHIIAAIDFGRYAGRLYLAMEYVQGVDAETYVEQHAPLSQACVWGLIRQAAAGLAHAHEQQIVHRDVKPANMLLVDPPTGYPLPPGLPMVKLADFGLSLLSHNLDQRTRLTSTNSTVGSPYYMSPEQFESPLVDFRADIYALGATAWHLLASVPPYHGATLTELVGRKIRGDIPTLSTHRGDIRSVTRDLLTDMMSVAPQDRPASYADLIGRIDEVLHEIGPESASLQGTQSVSSGRIRTQTSLPLGGTDDRNGVPGFGSSLESTFEAEPSEEFRRELERRAEEMARAAAELNEKRTGQLPSRFSRRTAITAGAGIVAAAGGIGAWAWLTAPPKPPIAAPSDLVPVGPEVPLFNGEGLTGWQTASGNWAPFRDEEESSVWLAGSSGLVRRMLPMDEIQTDAREKCHRVMGVLRMRQAKAIDVQFGLFGLPQLQGGWVCRLTTDSILTGELTSNGLPSQRWRRSTAGEPMLATQGVEFRIERHAAEWHVYVAGRLIDVLQPHVDEYPELRLAVVPGRDRSAAGVLVGDVTLRGLNRPAS